MANGMNDDVEGLRFEKFSGLEDGFRLSRERGVSRRTSPILPGGRIEPVAEPDGTTPFYEKRAMGAAEEEEILTEAEGDLDDGLPVSFEDARKAWEIDKAWDEHLGTNTAGADIY